MSLIDARSRFAARRAAGEEARLADIEKFRKGKGQGGGQFGNHDRLDPDKDVALVTDEPLTLDEVFAEMNELGELDDAARDIIDAPTTDTYTGTVEEQESLERRQQYNDLLRRAGIDPDTVPEDVAGEIFDRLADRQRQRKAAAEYELRNPKVPDHPVGTLPPATTARDRQLNEAVTAMIAARGYEVSEYWQDGIDHMRQWAGQEHDAGTLTSSLTEEVRRATEERLERERVDREFQEMNLGPFSEQAWEEALEEDRLRAQQEIRNLRRNNYVNLKDTNNLIRGNLKETFPDVKFSVRGDSYAGGASTRITYVDGPPLDDVEPAAKAFQGSTFDGMIDLKSHVSAPDFDANGIPVSTHYAADHVFVDRSFSEETTQEATTRAIKAFRDAGMDFDPSQHQYHAELPQALMKVDRISSQLWRGNTLSNNDILQALSTEVADEKWAAKTAK